MEQEKDTSCGSRASSPWNLPWFSWIYKQRLPKFCTQGPGLSSKITQSPPWEVHSSPLRANPCHPQLPSPASMYTQCAYTNKLWPVVCPWSGPAQAAGHTLPPGRCSRPLGAPSTQRLLRAGAARGLRRKRCQGAPGGHDLPWSFTRASISSCTPLCHSVMSTCRE